MTMMFPTKTSLVFIFILEFKVCLLTTVLSTADRVVNGQDLELICTHSTAIPDTSDVSVDWTENGISRGDIDKNCQDTFGPVDTALYNFSCPSIRNYTWTIKHVQESRNNSVWTCSIRIIGTQPYVKSDPTTIFVISPITNVSIDGNANVSADAGSQTTLSCTTSTGRPVSTIRWYFDAGTPSDTSDDEEITSTSEPVFDFGSETTSGSVTITAGSNMNDWRVYATANNTESMTPILSSNAVTLTVTASIDPTPGGCKICKWFVIIPCCWCIVLIVIVVLIIIIIIAGGCTLGYWWYKRIYLFDSPRTWPCSSRNKSDGSDETENRPLSTTVETTNETSPETKSLQSTKHDGYQVNNQVVRTEGSFPSSIKTGHSKVGPDDNQRSGYPEKNTAGLISEVNNERINTPRPLPILPKIGSKESSQAPNMDDVKAKKPKKKKKKKRKETEKDQIV